MKQRIRLVVWITTKKKLEKFQFSGGIHTGHESQIIDQKKKKKQKKNTDDDTSCCQKIIRGVHRIEIIMVQSLIDIKIPSTTKKRKKKHYKL